MQRFTPSLETITGHPNNGRPVLVGQVIVDLAKPTQGTSLGAVEYPTSGFYTILRAWLQGPFTGNRAYRGF